MNFAEQLALLPTVDHLSALELHDAAGTCVARIENRPGQAGSLRVYAALVARHGGQLNAQAAREGLALFAEHAEDARAHPGRHPNIDRLTALLASGAVLTGVPVPT